MQQRPRSSHSLLLFVFVSGVERLRESNDSNLDMDHITSSLLMYGETESSKAQLVTVDHGGEKSISLTLQQ